jgi:hypothetical protein
MGGRGNGKTGTRGQSLGQHDIAELRFAWHSVIPLPLRERVAEGRVRGASANNFPLTPAPSPSAGRGENGDPLN